MSIFLIAVGAILRYAVNVTVQGVEIDTVGLILIVVGIIGLVISLAVEFMGAGGRPRGPDDYPTQTALYCRRTTGARAHRAERAAAAPPTVEPDRGNAREGKVM